MRGRTDAKTGIRSLIEVDLWVISVVTFPMLPEARVEAVKSRGRAALLDGDPPGDRGDAGGVGDKPIKE